jgi:hypothetical protein
MPPCVGGAHMPRPRSHPALLESGRDVMAASYSSLASSSAPREAPIYLWRERAARDGDRQRLSSGVLTPDERVVSAAWPSDRRAALFSHDLGQQPRGRWGASGKRSCLGASVQHGKAVDSCDLGSSCAMNDPCRSSGPGPRQSEETLAMRSSAADDSSSLDTDAPTDAQGGAKAAGVPATSTTFLPDTVIAGRPSQSQNAEALHRLMSNCDRGGSASLACDVMDLQIEPRSSTDSQQTQAMECGGTPARAQAPCCSSEQWECFGSEEDFDVAGASGTFDLSLAQVREPPVVQLFVSHRVRIGLFSDRSSLFTCRTCWLCVRPASQIGSE